ncbi:tRNA (adenosine(37)-N6)-threonylcarbamoyltransferase complex dimerization subunit type 1 TsaB [Planctomonas psychrotolerans]|uniref:tRNA (adenosine(37)-N6)-threonylcarbamoyltransferase complex dimerization subunit type 1 TsaB n=1 Tax=Planctomonas psychrotolerans TaxID=2528712 RepID=UPI00123AB3C2|nr:tRNA (adenosine(37)-N6)-threonylcarbamoyltransferase complex dimerization subunit type 1 TsaB [Planctomonas psychrotolerans]
MLLAIDTSAGTSVALAAADPASPGGYRVRAERGTPDTMRHAEVIGAMIRDCLVDAGIPASEVTAVVAGMGPGPFTGLRVGIAAARAFALGRSIPVLPVVSHDAVAFDAFPDPSSAAAGAPPERVVVVTDARRRELYWSVYHAPSADGIPIRVDGPRLSAPDGVPHDLRRIDATVIPAGSLGVLAGRMRDRGDRFAAGDALYLRSPDVTPSRGQKRVTS